MKSIIKIVPEFFFIMLGVSWMIEDYFVNGTINYIAMLAVWLMFLQVIYKNRVLGLIYGNILALFSLYMMMEAFGGFSFASAFSLEGLRQITIGLGVFGTSVAIGVAMIYKFATTKSSYNESIFTVTY